MSMPDDVRDAAVRQVHQFCDVRMPEEVRAQMRLEVAVRGATITIVERRSPWNKELGGDWTTQPVAQLRYDGGSATWALYWPRHTGRWHRHEGVGSVSEVGPLLAELEADPDGVFWG